MSAWEILKKTTPMYLCLSKSSEYIEQDSIYISKSNVNHPTCNFAIIESSDAIVQKNIINKYFDCNGIVISKDSNKNIIEQWSNTKNMKYLGKAALLKKNETKTTASFEKYPDIVVERVINVKQFEDFFKIFTKSKNLKEEESVTMFSKQMFSEDYFFYVAYYDNQPAGIWSMIKNEDSLMIVEIVVLEEFRKLNILKAMASVAYSDAIKNKIYNYFAMATSQFSFDVAISYGYLIEDYAHLWILQSTGGVE